MGPFFKITMGIVAVSITLEDGRRQIVAIRAPGDCVGYLEEDGRYAFDGDALTDVEACAFDRRRFDALAARYPDLAAATAEALSKALKQAAEAMAVLGQLNATERVAHFLAEETPSTAGGSCRPSPFSLHEPHRNRGLSWTEDRDGQPRDRQAGKAEVISCLKLRDRAIRTTSRRQIHDLVSSSVYLNFLP